VNRVTVIQQAEQHGESAARVASRRRTTASTFRAATRHSRRVRFMRRAIPVTVVAAIVGVALAVWLNPLIGKLPVGLGDVVISGTKIRMEQPRLSGFTRDSRPYDLSAHSAAQDIAKPEMIELTKLRAKLQMHDRSQVELSAAAGLFDTKGQILTLQKEILVKSSSGYEAQLSEAVINTRTGNIRSEKPVTMKLSNGLINANTMEIEQAGAVVRFDRGVAMRLTPNKDQGKADGQVQP
jgi:lipopolysaccharide export system protein LptC